MDIIVHHRISFTCFIQGAIAIGHPTIIYQRHPNTFCVAGENPCHIFVLLNKNSHLYTVYNSNYRSSEKLTGALNRQGMDGLLGVSGMIIQSHSYL